MAIIFKKGIFTISIDTELAWGTDKDKVEKRRKQFGNTRKAINQLLELFAQYEISATWAIVGRLFLKAPKNDKNSFWCGQDIVKKIKDCSVPQEIASHSFSHLNFDEKKCSRKSAKLDLERYKELTDRLNIRFKSFIFPKNKIGYLELLYQNNFLCYRDIDNRWYEKTKVLPSIFKRILRVSEDIFVITPPCSLPRKRADKPLAIPASMMYRPLNGIWKFIPVKLRISRIKKGIDKAIGDKKIFHLWFHPFNLGEGTEELMEGLKKILKYASQKRKDGQLDIATMGEIYELYQKQKLFLKNK